MLCDKCNKLGKEQYGTIYEGQTCRKCGKILNKDWNKKFNNNPIKVKF